MIDDIVGLLAFANPGFFLIVAGLFSVIARGTLARAACLLGGPVLALIALVYGGEWASDLSAMNFAGLKLILYRVDSLSLVFGLAFIIASLICGVYSLHREDWLQDSTALIYAGAAVGAVFVGDLISLFIFWELTAVASLFQVLARRTPEASQAAMRYLAFQIASGVLLLAGVAMRAGQTGIIAFADMAIPGASPPVGVIDISSPGAVVILAAFAIKAGFPLLHNWIQDAYPKASETGTVVLSAFTTKLAVYALARCFAGLDALIWIGAIMTVFPIFFAVIENDLRKVLSYSLTNQVGFMVAAVGFGTELAINGAAAHAFVHVIYKSLLFMTMGAVLLRTGTTKASELGGLHRTMPWTALFCIIGAASISAVPLFSGFVAKSMTMSAAHSSGEWIVWILLLFASAGVLEHSGLKVPYFAFFGHDSGKRPEEAPFNMLFAMGMAAALCVGIGLFPGWLYQLLPYRDLAEEYLAQDLFSTSHVIEQFELLTFAVLAFLLLRRWRMYPEERPGVILDVEWLWRKGGPAALAWLGRPGGFAAAAWETTVTSLGKGVFAGVFQVFAPGAWVSRKFPLTAAAVWTVLLLGLVAALVMFSSL